MRGGHNRGLEPMIFQCRALRLTFLSRIRETRSPASSLLVTLTSEWIVDRAYLVSRALFQPRLESTELLISHPHKKILLQFPPKYPLSGRYTPRRRALVSQQAFPSLSPLELAGG